MSEKNADAEEAQGPVFTDADRLTLHQLQTLQCWIGKDSKNTEDTEQDESAATTIPEQWKLTSGIDLYEWQREAIEKWLNAGKRGTMKVVTGGGKTLLALALAERLQNDHDPDLRVAIVVPTIVLMNQWHDELVKLGNLPTSAIGRLGTGHQGDHFSDECRVMICVMVSAADKLVEMAAETNIHHNLLLVVDECHRIGAQKMSKVLETPRAYSLGLSATPERDENDNPTEGENKYDNSHVGIALGPIVHELTYTDALREGLIPPFAINHYGLPMNQRERNRHDQLSRSITEARQELSQGAPQNAQSGNSFFAWIQTQAGSNEAAGRFLSDTSKRKALIYGMEARHEAVNLLIEKELEVNPNAQILLFHENISLAMGLFQSLRERRLPVVVEHSKLTKTIRENGLELFRTGKARILVSVKSLIEGFNVPAVDIGIIVASSGSVRQRIQSMGRVMRRHRGQDGEESTSSIHILYARDTSEDSIYGEIDWERLTGAERNIYHHWTPGEEPETQKGPPRQPLPGEHDIDINSLEPGDEYPGAYAGHEYSCDQNLNITDQSGAYMAEPEEVVRKVIETKGQAGRFKITSGKNIVLIRKREGNDWITRFVMRLGSPLEPLIHDTPTDLETDADKWADSAESGQLYPWQEPSLRKETWKFKATQGGKISKRVPDGESYARGLSKAHDPDQGRRADLLLSKIHSLREQGEQITKLLVTEDGHVLYRASGELRYICDVGEGLDFPGPPA